MQEQAFWIPKGGDVFRATMHTQGPWNLRFQHAGPAGALLVRQLEHCSPRPEMHFGRISIDILGPIPIASIFAYARVTRPGRSVELVEAFLEHEGRLIMHASGWRILAATERPPASEPAQAPALPEQENDPCAYPEWRCGFLAATEWRFVRGDYASQGPAIAWTRLRYPLLLGEDTSPLQRLIAAADSANGISGLFDIRQWQFIPPELTIHCLRPPRGEWICMDANTQFQSEGVGLATADLYDQDGPVGRSAQALFISKRPQAK